LRYFLQRDADLQGAALRVFLRVVGGGTPACAKPGRGPRGSPRRGRFHPVVRFHLQSTPELPMRDHRQRVRAHGDGQVRVHESHRARRRAIAAVQECVRRWLLHVFVRRGLLPDDDARAMAQWEHGGGFSGDASVRIEAVDCVGWLRLLRCDRRKSPGGTAPGRRSTWNGCTNSIPNACSTITVMNVRYPYGATAG